MSNWNTERETRESMPLAQLEDNNIQDHCQNVIYITLLVSSRLFEIYIYIYIKFLLS